MNQKLERFLKSAGFEYILLSIVLILGLFLRLYKITAPVADWHSWRQADTASVTRTYVEKGINLLYPRYHDISSIQTGIANPGGYRFVEFPVYNAIHAAVFNLFPKPGLEVWGRLLTAVAGIVTAFFLFLIGKHLMGKWGGILAAAFFLTIPFNIYFGRVILPDPLGVTFGTVSLWTFLKFSKDGKNRYFYLSALFMALALLIKPYLGFYLFPIAYLAYGKVKIKKILFYLVLAFVPFLVWRMWEGQYPEGIPFYTWAFNGDRIRFHFSFWKWIFGERIGHLILGAWGLIPFVFGILPKVKNRFVNFFLLGALFYISVVATANVRHDYYQILTIPAISLALASGSIYLWNAAEFNKFLARSVLLLSVPVMFLTGWSQVGEFYKINHPEIIEAGQEVDRIAPKDAWVVAPYNGDTAFLYATKRYGWPAVDDSIDNIIKKGADYYVSVDLGSADTLNFEKRFKTLVKTGRYIILDLSKEL